MGQVDTVYEQMVYAEATSVLPLIISYAYHKGDWKNRKKMGNGQNSLINNQICFKPTT